MTINPIPVNATPAIASRDLKAGSFRRFLSHVIGSGGEGCGSGCGSGSGCGLGVELDVAKSRTKLSTSVYPQQRGWLSEEISMYN